jgi:6-phosphogluconolactonase (cycloisomerase 2 family)
MTYPYWRRLILAAFLLCGLNLLTACNGFFTCQGTGKATCPTTGSTATGTGDYAYVSNGGSQTSIYAYTLSSGALTAINGSPFNIGVTPSAMVVSANDSFLYVATQTSAALGYIYGFSINSYGGLTILNSGTKLAGGGTGTLLPVSMDVSPDGQWLFVLDATGELTEYSVNSTTGLLTFTQTNNCNVGISGAAGTQVKVSPTGKWVVCATGTAGDLAFALSSTAGTGISASPSVVITASYGDYALAMDDNDILYVGRTNSLVAYGLDSTTPAAALYSIGVGTGTPYAVTLDTTREYVYDLNYSSSSITGFGITNASQTSLTLTSLKGSPFSAPTDVAAIAPDNSGKYMLAEGYNSSTGLNLYSLTSGVLASVAMAGTGTTTSVPAIIAMTH